MFLPNSFHNKIWRLKTHYRIVSVARSSTIA
jgi:hypothetical protein